MKISFLCFDISDNSFGRAALLATALSKHFDVELIGPAKQGMIWPPLKDIKLPVKLFPWRRYPKFLLIVRQMLKEINGDILFACKVRSTSFGIGLIKKKLTGKPLFVDIDDWELGFFYHTDFWGKLGRFLNLSNPNGLPYTWLMEHLVCKADGISVSNNFLQKRFGGELIYHCRDTNSLDPGKFDSMKSKQNLGLGGKKILMFLGTPRTHKGVDDLICAMENLKRPDIRLVIIGSSEQQKSLIRKYPSGMKEKISIFPPVPFKELGKFLAAADIVVVPQRQSSDTLGQMPAKIFDAMAMAKPIISTRVSDIPEVLNGCGYLVEPGNVKQLVEKIEYILRNEDEATLKGQEARKRCKKLYDIKIIEKKLVSLIRKKSKLKF